MRAGDRVKVYARPRMAINGEPAIVHAVRRVDRREHEVMVTLTEDLVFEAGTRLLIPRADVEHA
jgi:hypothetical protein